ncbi:scavenger receptor class F member 1 [Brachyhypopomus gauderio]|uniref:scavenger receptor class F member 1 n=1 Tax=Brachyhypopomus gauderio TaxID=698409 RepID=UPI00404316EF
MELRDTVPTVLVLLLCSLASSHKLSPTGRNVCLSPRDSSLVCCSGWAQQDGECSIPLCVGATACTEDEVCVYPGVCRCKPGFFGFRCKTSCPPEFWGSDCRELCPCHPHGRCDPVTGKCTCLPSRWGHACQNVCRCGRHGRCDPASGNCTCEEGWWSLTCTKACSCHPGGASTCDPATGLCLCQQGYWGQKCSLRCSCYMSPCRQRSGDCVCQEGWWGGACDRRCICDLRHGECVSDTGECVCEPGYRSPICKEPCAHGYYGSGCTESCGHCVGGRPCNREDGSCDACAPGWNGSRCDRPCLPGYYGNGCQEACPRCRREEPCDVLTGACSSCDPGWTGPRCDQPCPNGMFGDSCRFLCGPCFHGQCDHVTGSCLCHPGFQGRSCNGSCPDHLYGLNCSSSCDCGGDTCDSATGTCPYSRRAGLIAGLLIPLLVLILVVLFCCCCCWSPAGGKHRVAVGDGSTAGGVKHHVYTALANMGSAVPCLTLWSSGLPRVTVSHHDPELTFNHSFIEPPSSGWVTDSFETDEDGEAVYCVPPTEDEAAVVRGAFQELSSKCNVFPDPCAFGGEDVEPAFDIPRTSSMAKAKRPSVSFAEGTRFSPKERRGSCQEPPVTAVPAPSRKPKAPWGVLMVSTLQGEAGLHGEVGGERDEVSDETSVSAEERTPEPSFEPLQTESRTHLTVPANRRRTLSNGKKSLQLQVSGDGREARADVEKVTTVYVTLGKAPRGGGRREGGSEGPVQAVLRRLGSLQRQKEQVGRPQDKGKTVEKPPRRKLGARASAWEQVSGGGASEVVMRKPSRRKHNTLDSSRALGGAQENSASKRPLSSILKSVPEGPARGSGVNSHIRAASETEALYDNVAPSEAPYGTVAPSEAPYGTVAPSEAPYGTIALSEAPYGTVAPSEEASPLSEIINDSLPVQDEEPNYENVYIRHL